VPKSTQWSSCTAQRNDGSFCDRPTVPDAPFPICTKHASQLYAFIRESIDDASSDPERAAAAMMALCARRQQPGVPTFDASTAVVYYVQIGEHIKIGCSTNVKARLSSYPPNRRLLATEPGYEHEEAQRLSQFAEYRDMGREWFRPGLRLVEHINMLRRKQRAAPIVIAA